jgi:hypothetical protein
VAATVATSAGATTNTAVNHVATAKTAASAAAATVKPEAVIETNSESKSAPMTPPVFKMAPPEDISVSASALTTTPAADADTYVPKSVIMPTPVRSEEKVSPLRASSINQKPTPSVKTEAAPPTSSLPTSPASPTLARPGPRNFHIATNLWPDETYQGCSLQSL